MGKRNILIISFSDLKNDPRVRRQISCLLEYYNITAVGLRDAEIQGVEFLPAVYETGKLGTFRKACLLKARRFEQYYRFKYAPLHGLEEVLASRKFDLVIANEIDALPFALRAAPHAKVLLDCHEYAPREMEDLFVWRFLYKRFKEYLCNKYMSRCHRVTTVCDGIADEYERNFGIRPAVITNAVDYIAIEPSSVDEKQIRLIHHGGAIPSRRIELMIEMMAMLDERFTLTLMLVKSDLEYYRKLVQQSAGNPRIIFREPVPLADIVSEINRYDIGVYILEPNSFNNKHALPNKFFEFVQARLAIAIGPSPEMAGLVQAHDLGVVAADFNPQTLASELNKLTPEKIQYYKQRSCEAAKLLSSEANRSNLLKIIGELLD
jgi:glycosyltransferase involved in cell wall biosynthesis